MKKDDPTFMTLSMARVYEGQGHYGEAERIYRYLLEKEPDRTDLKDALDNLKRLKLQDREKRCEIIGSMLLELIDLFMRQKRLRLLKEGLFLRGKQE